MDNALVLFEEFAETRCSLQVFVVQLTIIRVHLGVRMELVFNAPPTINSDFSDQDEIKSSVITEAIYCAKIFKLLNVEEVTLRSGLSCWGNPSQCFCLTYLGEILYWPRATPRNWELEDVGFTYGKTILNSQPQLLLFGLEDLTHRFLDN